MSAIADFSNRDENDMNDKLTTWDVVALGNLVRIAAGGHLIRWVMEGHETQSGIARGLTDQNGCTMHDADVRDTFLRVTTSGFGDRFIPVRDAMRMIQGGLLAADRDLT